MKFAEGDNTFRVMSSAIIGYEYFTKENKPIRSREPFDETPADIKDKGVVKHFWAFVVWNYEAKRIQVLELTQKTIMTSIKALTANPKWGDPHKYDITVTRTGSGMETEYNVMPNPHAEVTEEIASAYLKANINLPAIFDNGDPFQK